MFQRIKSPIGEVVGNTSVSVGYRYELMEYAQDIYQSYVRLSSSLTGFTVMSFADWLEAQGVRLV